MLSPAATVRLRLAVVGALSSRKEPQMTYELFGEVISAYSRAQAIEDGVLVDVSSVAREAGIKFPVAMTRTVWGKYVEVPEGVKCQDEHGRLWGIPWMFRCAAAKFDGDTLLFKLYVRNRNRARLDRRDLVTFKALCGPGDDAEPVITIMLPEEDGLLHELRLWLNLYLPSVKLVKKVRVGSKVRRVYDTRKTPWERVMASAAAHPEQIAALKKLRASLDPFQLGKVIERKIESIYEMANRRHSPQATQKKRNLPAEQGKMSPRPGCGKDARGASLEIASRFPLSHSHDDELPVTFLMSRRVLPK